nr:MAG TPA: capsid protein [Cressdnaviricota sp.]
MPSGKKQVRKRKPSSKRRQPLNRQVRTLINDREIKFYDTSSPSTAIVASATMAGLEQDPVANNEFGLSAPAVGDGDSNRDGKKITVYSLQLDGAILYPAQTNQSTADFSPVVDLYVVLDKQTNQAQLNSEDVLTNTSADTNCPAMRDLGFVKRFRILKHIKFTAPLLAITFDGTNIEQTGVQKNFHYFHKFKKPMVVNFLGGSTAAAIASVIDNSIHIIARVSNSTLAPTLVYNSRIRFVG